MNPNKALWEKGDFTQIAAFVEAAFAQTLSPPHFGPVVHRRIVKNSAGRELPSRIARR